MTDTPDEDVEIERVRFGDDDPEDAYDEDDSEDEKKSVLDRIKERRGEHGEQVSD